MKKGIFIFLLLLLAVTSFIAYSTNTRDIDVQIEQQSMEVQPVVSNNSQAENMNEEANQSLGPPKVNIIDPNTGKIIQTIIPINEGFEADFKRYKQNIEKLAKELARGTENEKGYDQRMVLDKIDTQGRVIKGSPMVILKEQELVDRIVAVSKNGGDIELPIYVTETGYSEQDVPYLKEEIIASYTTYFNSSDQGRVSNIQRSADAISNVIVGNGDYFSFNTTVGPRTEETGYQPALEIVNGKFEMGIGGGICQTSTTLFNAVDQLSVKLLERHHHSIEIGYVPKGRDATVSFGSLDFRFQNTTGIPFMIQTMTTESSITVEIRTAKKYVQTN